MKIQLNENQEPIYIFQSRKMCQTALWNKSRYEGQDGRVGN